MAKRLDDEIGGLTSKIWQAETILGKDLSLIPGQTDYLMAINKKLEKKLLSPRLIALEKLHTKIDEIGTLLSNDKNLKEYGNNFEFENIFG